MFLTSTISTMRNIRLGPISNQTIVYHKLYFRTVNGKLGFGL